MTLPKILAKSILTVISYPNRQQLEPFTRCSRNTSVSFTVVMLSKLHCVNIFLGFP